MMNSLKYRLAFVLCGPLAFSAGGFSQRDVHASAPDQGVFISQADRSAAPPPAPASQQTSEQLQQLLAPVALYPDPLLAQILAASTYPTEVVEAWRWMQKHSDLKGQQLANAVDPQPWDPSVKALTQFPSVLGSMNENLRWTSALGDAYLNEQKDVLDTVQTLRQRAQTAGSLRNTSQQTVTTQDQAIAIEPTDAQVVYVPAYDPWLVYGAPFAAFPGWVTVPGIYYAGSDLYFGTGFAVGLLGFGWGWNHWGFDWYHRTLMHDHAPYVSHSKTFAHRHDLDQRGAHFDHGVPHFDNGAPIRGGSPERTQTFYAPATQGHAVARSGAFSSFDHGGIARGYSFRGRSSFGGAGAFRGGGAVHGGGAFHGGGGFGGVSHGGGGIHR